MTQSARWTLRSVATAMVFIAAGPTRAAAGSDPGAAEALFREGQRLVESGSFAEACPKFAESFRLDPAPGTMLNQADCEEHVGQLSSAVAHYRAAIDLLSNRDARVPIATKRLTELDARVPRLTISAASPLPAGTTILRDSVQLGEASLGVALPVDPGEHIVIVRAPGRRERAWHITLGEGDKTPLLIEAGVLEASKPPNREVPKVEPSSHPSGSSARTIGYVAGGIGLAALGLGTAYALRAKARDDDARALGCDDTTCPYGNQRGLDLTKESQRAATVAALAFVIGGVAVAGGTTLVLLSPSSKQANQARIKIVPSAFTSLMGVSAVGSW